MIKLENISKIYPGSPRKALDDLSMTFEEGTTTALIGPSGCGKTTTMRLINRLEQPTSGRVWVNGRDVAAEDPVMLRRHIGYVIQNVGLFPHMTVADNIATVPRLLGWSTARIQARVETLLELVGLDARHYASRFPAALSGGQRQRVGVARALAADPPVMLMDEPFGAIDPLVRGRLQTEFKQILQRVKKTVIIVTHDLDEAIKMGDRIAIMREGRLCQYASPAEVLSAPADEF
ncbi:ABC transporter ATP-binding protein, partial [Raoultella sp. Ech2A]|uniref:ABC transporter ATP-binding protein n=1 Tax=Raoultella sp. Ech2A TaxID=2996539 RepID=UPI0024BF19CF